MSKKNKRTTQQNLLWQVVKHPQSYKNIAYLLLAFPTGLAYFLLFIIGGSMGASMAIIGVGVLILWLTFGLGRLALNIEREIANNLIQTDFDVDWSHPFSLSRLRDGDIWRGFAFMLLKFPLGVITFSITLMIIALVLGLIAMPLSYVVADSAIVFAREIDTLWEALLASGFGLFLLPFALVLLNKLALMWRGLSNRMLQERASQITKQKRIDRSELQADVRHLLDEAANGRETLYDDFQQDKQASSYS